ncbi:MAG: hypothetical protein ACLP8B_07045, partial [Xanthobacteraceae bacterium]
AWKDVAIFRSRSFRSVILRCERAGRCSASEVRAQSQQGLTRTSEASEHRKIYETSAAFDLKFLGRVGSNLCRNFKSAALGNAVANGANMRASLEG